MTRLVISFVHSFIHFLLLSPVSGRGVSGAYPSIIGRRRVHPEQVTKGGTVAQWLALSPHSKKVLDSNPSRDVSVRSLHVLLVSMWVYSGFLPQSKNM